MGHDGRDHSLRDPYIVLDVGSNHAGDFELAMEFIREVAGTGADAVKFQLTNDIPDYPGAPLPLAWLPKLKDYAAFHRLDFGCTPFTQNGIDTLDPFVDYWKIGSRSCMAPLTIPDDKRPLFVSFGYDTIEEAMTRWGSRPIYMQCVPKYPTPVVEITYPLPGVFGYSSHTETWHDSYVARTLGAKVFERHIRLKGQPNAPDNGPWALYPKYLTEMVKALHGT